jgi:hypothetical protein
MHEKRNFTMVLLLVGSIIWAALAWFVINPDSTTVLLQRTMSLLMVITLGAWLFYSMTFEDKLPDHLAQVVGEFYYECDGLSFMPMIRVRDGQAELCVYYQNRYENIVEAIVHLRPPPPEDSFIIQPGMRDVHFAFRASGGDFGVIHQPIAVPRHLQSEVIEVKMAASSWYPRSHGARLRKRPGMACGSVLVDWVGNPLKIGVHEVSGEIPLQNPVTLRLAMPSCVSQAPVRSDIWRQEKLSPGAAALA